MKIVVLGGTGLIGSKVVALLRGEGHTVEAASPSSGVNTLTGEGLPEVLTGADVVVDVTNSPSFAPDDVRHFFTTSTTNVLAAEQAAGVGHHVVLTIVGTHRSPDNAYFAAKVAQENLVAASGVPYSFVAATQFIEFVPAIAQAGTVDGVVRIPPVAFQPIASDDVARFVADAAAGEPINGTHDVAGPELGRFDVIVREWLQAVGDEREVVADADAAYFGSVPTEGALVPEGDARLGTVTIADLRPRA